MQNAILYMTPVLIWGFTWYVIKFQLGIVDPLLSIGYRFALSFIVMIIWGFGLGLFKGPRLTLRQQLFTALMGFLLFFLNYWMFYNGTKSLTSGLVSVCFSTITIMNIFNQWLFFGLPVKRQVMGGSALGLAGITLVFWHEIIIFDFHSATVHALGLCLLATYVASLGNIISLRNSRDNMPVFKTTCYGMAYGALSAFIVAFAIGAPFNFDWSLSYVLSLGYLSVLGSAVAFIAYLTLIMRIGADKAAYTAVVIPIIALGISTFYEHYAWTAPAIAGLALVILGNILALSKKKIL